MRNASSLVVRIAFAALAGIVAFLIVLLVGAIIAKVFDAHFGSTVSGLAALIGLLVAIIYFFARSPGRPIV